jgi:hypothetical protein
MAESSASAPIHWRLRLMDLMAAPAILWCLMWCRILRCEFRLTMEQSDE